MHIVVYALCSVFIDEVPFWCKDKVRGQVWVCKQHAYTLNNVSVEDFAHFVADQYLFSLERQTPRKVSIDETVQLL
jgi:hypothetical protein